jgi:hypothetical protein
MGMPAQSTPNDRWALFGWLEKRLKLIFFYRKNTVISLKRHEEGRDPCMGGALMELVLLLFLLYVFGWKEENDGGV